MKPIRKSISQNRDLRNQEINLLYKRLMNIDGSQRTAVAEYIAGELTSTGIYGKVSYSTVMRITK